MLLVLLDVVSLMGKVAVVALTLATPRTPSQGLPAETLPQDLRNLPLDQNVLQDRPV